MTTHSTLWQAVEGATLVDLSQTYEEHMPSFPTHAKFYHNLWASYRHGHRSLHYQLIMSEHNGTHVDAPAHFVRNYRPDAHSTIDQVPLTSLIGRGARLDCRQFKAGDSAPKRFIIDWETRHRALAAVNASPLYMSLARGRGGH